MNQILESAYREKPRYWQAVAKQQGGLEICNDYDGQPIYTIGANPDVWY
ncbi:hypothetical protein [Lactobacillus bombicola]|nr:hypothetical protein [Lactobacillus bombicola]